MLDQMIFKYLNVGSTEYYKTLFKNIIQQRHLKTFKNHFYNIYILC